MYFEICASPLESSVSSPSLSSSRPVSASVQILSPLAQIMSAPPHWTLPRSSPHSLNPPCHSQKKLSKSKSNPTFLFKMLLCLCYMSVSLVQLSVFKDFEFESLVQFAMGLIPPLCIKLLLPLCFPYASGLQVYGP